VLDYKEMVEMPKTERRSEKAKKDYEDRKAQAMAHGKEALFLTCPLCGINRPLKMWGKDTRFKVKPEYAIITVRKGGGRRIGFFRVEDGDIQLPDLKEYYPEVWKNLFEEVNTLQENMILQLRGSKKMLEFKIKEEKPGRKKAKE